MFFQVDDKLSGNVKVRRLIEGTLVGDYRGMAALGLWTLAGSESQRDLTDGVLSRVDLARITVNLPMADELADLLVAAGLWHLPGHGCDDCDPVPDGHVRFHQWWQFAYDAAEKVKTTRGKRAELKDPDVRDQVWARDCTDPTRPNFAACRYCGRHVNRKDTSSQLPDGTGPDLDRRAHLEHVDPSKAAGVRNLVVACGRCNRTKGQRTPAQAGMTLRPAPAHSDPALDIPTVVSPPQRAAETTTAPLAASPPTRAAETPQSHQGPSTTPTSARGPLGLAGRDVEAGTGAGRAEQQQEQSTQQAPPAVPGRTREGGHAGAGRVGQGRGEGWSPGEDAGQPRSRRSRRRGRGRPPTDQRPAPPTDPDPPGQPHPSWDAGPAPAVTTPGRWGSPHYGRTSRRDDAPETRCQTHPGEHLPCRRCREETP